MERNSTQQHTFRIKNVGNALLTLEPGRTTCKCTVSDVTGSELKPGETTEVTAEWTGKVLGAGPDFEQTIEIITNALEEKILRLKIRGYVTETVRALPPAITIGRVSSNGGTEAEFRLFGFRSDQIDILETVFENDELARYFELAYEPLAKEEIEQEKGASCGLLAKLVVKPGLPLGPINQTIRIRANVDKEAVVHLPVRGRAVSDIIVASSRQFEANKGLLTFGALKRTESAKAVLHVYVTGPHRHTTQLSVGERDPATHLEVNISPPQELNNGKTVKYLVTIEVPPGKEPTNRLGSTGAPHGRVVLETTHPQTKQVPISVKFAVD
jgi:hypothetical protein